MANETLEHQTHPAQGELPPDNTRTVSGRDKNQKDAWDKLSSAGGIVAAVTTVILGLVASSFLARLQEREAKTRLYSELMSKREQAESELRKDMFGTIMDKFLKLKPESPDLDASLVNLELLSVNFHEFLDFRPLFYYMQRQIDGSRTASRDKKKEYSDRLERLAQGIANKQMIALAGVAARFPITDIDLGTFQSYKSEPKEVKAKFDPLKRRVRVFGVDFNREKKELLVRLEVVTPRNPLEPGPLEAIWDGFFDFRDVMTPNPERPETTDIWVGFFDFPMVDNIRLSEDQRCAIVLTQFDDHLAAIEVLLFPGWASMKEKPYYQEIFERLKEAV